MGAMAACAVSFLLEASASGAMLRVVV